jgi:hypothetical protein
MVLFVLGAKERSIMNWRGVPDTNLEVSEDGTQFRWTFDRDGALFLATELYGDGTGRDLHRALDVADELQRIALDQERYGFAIVMVDRRFEGAS